MKKLFGRDKPKMARVTPVSRELTTGLATNTSEEQYQPSLRRTASQSHEGGHTLGRSSSEDHWEVISPHVDPAITNTHTNLQATSHTPTFASLPPGASPPVHSPAPRSSSPFSVVSNPQSSHRNGTQRERERDTPLLKKKTPVPTVAALGVLMALDPQNGAASQLRSRSEEHLTPSENSFREDKKEKKAFWERSITRDKEKDKSKDSEKDRRDEDSQAELTRMIGYLTATASEDWALVLEVCDRASADETHAKEAVRALRREFKYGEPPAQLAAARLWAIMLRNSSEIFIYQSTSRKFLDTIEAILMSPRTSPVVRERLIDIVGAAAYASGTKIKDSRSDKDGFRGLWRRIKPADKPDIGMPFDIDDAMFTPPASIRVPRSSNDVSSLVNQEQGPLFAALFRPVSLPRKRKTPFSHDRIIPLEEDMRRLFQECRIGQGNASLLSESLAFVKPEDLTKKDIIREFYLKCRSSQELIFAQIPWASAGAERSRSSRGRSGSGEAPVELTTQEQLLAELLAANEALLEALRAYDDLERVAIERRAEERSRKDTGLDNPQLLYGIKNPIHVHRPSADVGNSSSSLPPSPSSSSIQSDSVPSKNHVIPRFLPNLDTISTGQAALAPPPPAPHGPRSPAQMSLSSRTPSPVTPSRHSPSSSLCSSGDEHSDFARVGIRSSRNSNDMYDHPSAKALGKRKVAEADELDRPFEGEDIFNESKDELYLSPDRRYSDTEHPNGPWQHHVHYVYDAAAERTQQRIREGQLVGFINGVH